MSREHYRTVKEGADLLQVNEVTLRRWITDGELRAIDIGKRRRIGPDDLDTFLDGHATRPARKSNGSADTASDKAPIQETKDRKN